MNTLREQVEALGGVALCEFDRGINHAVVQVLHLLDASERPIVQEVGGDVTRPKGTPNSPAVLASKGA